MIPFSKFETTDFQEKKDKPTTLFDDNVNLHGIAGTQDWPSLASHSCPQLRCVWQDISATRPCCKIANGTSFTSFEKVHTHTHPARPGNFFSNCSVRIEAEAAIGSWQIQHRGRVWKTSQHDPNQRHWKNLVLLDFQKTSVMYQFEWYSHTQ